MSLLTGWLNRWRNSALLRRLGALTSGAALAQIVQMLNFVVLAKLYALPDVGVYSVFVAVVSTLAPAAVLGYEMLIPACADDDLDVFLRALLLMLPATVLALVLLAMLLSYGHAAALGLWVFGAVVLRVAEMHNVRRNRFAWVAIARIAPPLTMAILLASYWARGVGDITQLILWQSGLTLLSGLVYAAWTLPRSLFRGEHRVADLKAVMLAKLNAPIYLLPSNLLNLLAYNLPVLVIGKWFGPELAAQYAYVLRFGFGPVGLIGGTLYQVFYGFLSEAARTGNRAMFAQFVRARRLVGWAALAAAAAMALVYPLAFRLAFGASWETAGWIAMIFAPFFAAMLYLTPQSVSLNVFNRQHVELRTQWHYFLVSICSFGLALLSNNAWVGFILFSGLGCLRYLLLYREIEKVLVEHNVLSREAVARP